MWFVHAFAFGSRAGDEAADTPQSPVSTLRAQVLRGTLIALNLMMFAGILWIGVSPSELERAFVEGFGIVAAVLAGYAVWGAFSPRASASWCFGIIVLSANFGAFALALHLLT